MDAPASLLWPDSQAPRRGPKPKMTRDGIVAAAIRLADEGGLAAVSMQRVADALGATKMSIYRYVPGKAELAQLMLDEAVGAPPQVLSRHHEWRPALAAWALELSSCFAATPWALELAVGARVIGPNELAWLEAGLAPLADTPLTGAEKLDVLALLSGHIRGIVDQERSSGSPERELSALMLGIVRARRDEYPAAAAAFDEAAASGEQDAGLRFGLERILDGVGALLVSRGSARPR